MNIVDKAKMTGREKVMVAELEGGSDGYIQCTVTRQSNREFDLNLEGTKRSGMGFGAWLPLAIISKSEWPMLARYSDYPDMVAGTWSEEASPDWSGIRDSSEEAIWDMFRRVRA